MPRFVSEVIERDVASLKPYARNARTHLKRQIILDGFGGSGSTLIAAEKAGRSARLIEYDPIYCDTIVRRWQAYSGKDARLAGCDSVFDDIAEARLNTPAFMEVSQRTAMESTVSRMVI